MTVPEPVIERIPKAVDGSTWYAYSDEAGYRIVVCPAEPRRALFSLSQSSGSASHEYP